VIGQCPPLIHADIGTDTDVEFLPSDLGFVYFVFREGSGLDDEDGEQWSVRQCSQALLPRAGWQSGPRLSLGPAPISPPSSWFDCSPISGAHRRVL